jgi:hypothetical protein
MYVVMSCNLMVFLISEIHEVLKNMINFCHVFCKNTEYPNAVFVYEILVCLEVLYHACDIQHTKKKCKSEMYLLQTPLEFNW